MTKADRKGCGAYDAPQEDLREWIERTEDIGYLLDKL